MARGVRLMVRQLKGSGKRIYKFQVDKKKTLGLTLATEDLMNICRIFMAFPIGKQIPAVDHSQVSLDLARRLLLLASPAVVKEAWR